MIWRSVNLCVCLCFVYFYWVSMCLYHLHLCDQIYSHFRTFPCTYEYRHFCVLMYLSDYMPSVDAWVPFFFCCGKYGRTHSPTHTCPYEAHVAKCTWFTLWDFLKLLVSFVYADTDTDTRITAPTRPSSAMARTGVYKYARARITWICTNEYTCIFPERNFAYEQVQAFLG